MLTRTETASTDGFPGFSAPSLPLSLPNHHNPTTERKHDRRVSGPCPSSPTLYESLDEATPIRDRRDTNYFENSRAENAPNQYSPRRDSVRDDPQRVERALQMQTFADVTSAHSRGTSVYGGEDTQSFTAESTKSMGTEEPQGLVTTRFKHVVTEEGHAVIIGRDGDTLQRCEDEPIHIPGAVQGFGLLIALQEIDDKLQVRVVSENSRRLIGYTPKQLFELESFTDILSEEQTDNLLDHIDFIKDEDVDPAVNGPEVFTLAIRSPSRRLHKVWCAMHINETNRNLIICEFELEDDPINPLVPFGDATPEPPEDTLNSDPTPEEYAESTVNASKPLRVLRSARKRKGEAAAMEVFNIMSQVQEQLANATSLEAFLKILVGVVKELTGFHRVMIYQFDSNWNGRVVTELVDPRATKDLYKGLNFPASDIPKQARDLYKVNKVRLLYDRDQETARLVCRTTQDLETPIDLTFAYLRAMSPIHIKYLTNMAVRASMSISINAFNELWGLIACHSYGSKGMRVSFPIRKMCRLVGDSASRNIERLSYASRLQARKLINTVPTESNPSGYIIASSEDLLKLFDADYGLLSIRDETKILGKLENTQEALALLEYLRLRKIGSVTASTDIRFDFPDLRYPPGFSVIAGLLLVPLSVAGSDFIVFFRRGQTRQVKWAGNPYEKFVKEGTEGYLEPRKSFKTWCETVVGKCREWTEEQIETAAVLCLVYGKFIEVWRQKEAALQNSQLTRLLLANSAHEVRTPLNAIINYLEIALEGTIDQETRDNLARSHSASKSLIYVINDLLDLTKTEEGHNLTKDEVFDLPATIREATQQFVGDAKRKQIDYETVEKPGVPQLVVGDQRRIRQAVSNVTANAIQHTSHGGVRVEIWLASHIENRVEIEIVVQDTGTGMSSNKLDALFNELEQVHSESDEGLQERLAPETQAVDTKETQKRILGLGLAVVARTLRNMGGQLRLKSEEGKGSRFVMQIGFELPDQVDGKKQGAIDGPKEPSALAAQGSQPTTPPVELGEVMLVKSASKSSRSVPEMSHRKSTDSVHSIASMKSMMSGSSTKSEVDRLIEAIQEPHLVSNDAPSRSNSRAQVRSGSGSSARRPLHGLSRTNSTHAVLQTTNIPEADVGTLSVTDSKTPIKPIRMPGQTVTRDDFSAEPIAYDLLPRSPSKVIFDIPDKPQKNSLDATCLQVLVAEDDPINSKIIKKRLEKLGHEVHLTINGEECASQYCEKPSVFDVVLMDIQVSDCCPPHLFLACISEIDCCCQMPIVDGLTSTKMIRSHEKIKSKSILSRRATLNGRVPIFAVSASLIEKERENYVNVGFDGWILKPIDFKRLSVLMDGIVHQNIRRDCLYTPGQWERGGWFCDQQPDTFAAHTTPSSINPVSSSTPPSSYPAQANPAPEDEERARLNRLDGDAVHADSAPDNPGRSGHLEHAVEGT